jgi:hypothetical protein
MAGQPHQQHEQPHRHGTTFCTLRSVQARIIAIDSFFTVTFPFLSH